MATVRKAGDKKAIVDLEKQGQTEYVIEGDLAQRNYVVKLTANQVAQVNIYGRFSFTARSELNCVLPCQHLLCVPGPPLRFPTPHVQSSDV